jgi:ABC-type glutathione transport system ATPase component
MNSLSLSERAGVRVFPLTRRAFGATTSPKGRGDGALARRAFGATTSPKRRGGDALTRRAFGATTFPKGRGDGKRMSLLVADNLTKFFARSGGAFARGGPRIAAVEDVSFTLARGEKLGVVGESGSGKTTLGRLALGLLRPDAGRALFDGVDVHRATGAAQRGLRRRMQMIFQDSAGAFDPRLRIGDAVAEPLRVHGIGANEAARRDIVAAWLQKVGLDADLARRRPHELSGGQRQRAGIARALAVGPDLLAADEPVASLDVSVQTQILRLLADLTAETGVALFFISHDLRVVRALTERVLVLWRGRPVEMGPTARVIARPLHAYTRALMAAIPTLDPAARRLLLAADAVPEPREARGVWREEEPGHWIAA